MGMAYRGIHEKMALGVIQEFGIKTLVETGTYRGETVAWALNKFDRIISIELSDEFFTNYSNRFKDNKNVLLIKGDSREWLAPVCQGRHNEPTLFWLDAHATNEGTTRDPKGCAVLDEITIINKNFFGLHVIMIDDCLLLEQYGWAKRSEIIPLLEDNGNHDREVAIMDDVYFAAHRIPDRFISWAK